MKKKHRPDFLLVLAIVVGIGVVLTMKTQASATSQLASNSNGVSTAVVNTTTK